MMLPRGGKPGLEDFQSQIFTQGADFHHQPARKARAHTLVESFEFGRRTIGGDDHLPAGIDQGIERMAKLDLRRLALQELEVIDHQNVDGAQRILEGECILRPQRGDKAVHEPLSGKIKHLSLGRAVSSPGDRLK